MMDFFAELEQFRLKLRDTSERPNTLVTSAGTHGVTYGTDEDDLDYALVGACTSKFIMTEIDDGTYGNLQGFRIYGWV